MASWKWCLLQFEYNAGQGLYYLHRHARRGVSRATVAKAAETAVQDDNAAPHPCHNDVPAHQAAASQVSAIQADDGVPHPRDHDPVTRTRTL